VREEGGVVAVSVSGAAFRGGRAFCAGGAAGGNEDRLRAGERRVYLDHRNWREVAGAALFNNFIEVMQASWHGVPERWSELADLPAASRLYWRLYAVPWTVSQNLAQYLGSRSYKASLKFHFWSAIDDFLARGV
jgi:hypothetical protein